MATLKEVAQLAQVSTATVSKVLSDTPYVTPETRARVLQAIAELGYVPNIAARALSKGRTYIIGVIFPYNYDHLFADPLMLSMLEGVETACTERGYNMLLSTPRIPLNDSEQYQRLVNSSYFDGVIALETLPGEPVSTALEEHGYLWIAIGYRSVLGTQNTINSDDFGGAKAIAGYVLQLGHRNVAIIGVEDQALAVAERRMAGYRGAFDEAGIDFENVIQMVGNFSINGGYQAMGDLLQADPRPTAVLCLNDRMAFGAIQRAMAEGLRVPEDISILGYDDIADSAYFNPPLTTVRQPAREMGIKAAEMLFERIERKNQRKASPDHGHDPVTFPTELVIRHSATTPGGGDANLSSR